MSSSGPNVLGRFQEEKKKKKLLLERKEPQRTARSPPHLTRGEGTTTICTNKYRDSAICNKKENIQRKKIRGPFCQVIYSQFGLAIHQNDHQARRRFVEWAQNEIAVVPDFHKRILFSDEAHFWLNGYVNKQNCRLWSEANPQVAVITNFFIPEFNNHDVQELWFQQDGATCHTARATIDLLKDTFGDRLISRFGPVNWPPRSCDLSPLDYFLWGYEKSLVYADKPQTLDHLEDNFRRVIADIRPQMLKKSSKIGLHPSQPWQSYARNHI
ncbi:uncharacterized protein TNCV_3831501 [Trichonephila clavipes]|nr:uncharacterized protein TNCV_3831501 [Trichonephila clavipes]